MPATDTIETTELLVGPRRCRTRPSAAVRVGARPAPRVRPLAEVLAELVRRHPTTSAAPTTAPRHVEVPDPRPAALRMLRAVAEVLDGARPATHLRPVCDEDVWRRRVAPLHRSSRHHATGRVRGVRVCPVSPHAAEIAAVVHRDGRARALAGRLEHDGRGWRLTALEAG